MGMRILLYKTKLEQHPDTDIWRFSKENVSLPSTLSKIHQQTGNWLLSASEVQKLLYPKTKCFEKKRKSAWKLNTIADIENSVERIKDKAEEISQKVEEKIKQAIQKS